MMAEYDVEGLALSVVPVDINQDVSERRVRASFVAG
jgi:hypothetical protein